MGLFANITAVEAAHTLSVVRAIGIALGDTKSLAGCIYEMTGDARLAQSIEVRANMNRGING